MITTISEIKAILKNSRYAAVRGLSDNNAKKKYRRGQILERSFDLWDERDTEYKGGTPRLNGTSGIALPYWAEEAEILKVIEDAKKYADDDKICLIVGDRSEAGMDNNEVVLGTSELFSVRGAKFIDYIAI